MLVSHFDACFYYLISHFEGLGSNTWVQPSPVAHSDIPVSCLSCVDPTYAEVLKQYLASLYWSTSLLMVNNLIIDLSPNNRQIYVTSLIFVWDHYSLCFLHVCLLLFTVSFSPSFSPTHYPPLSPPPFLPRTPRSHWKKQAGVVNVCALSNGGVGKEEIKVDIGLREKALKALKPIEELNIKKDYMKVPSRCEKKKEREKM